jgi:hypothetical protein
LFLEVVVLVVGLESLQEVWLLGILPLEFTTGMGGVVALRRRGGMICRCLNLSTSMGGTRSKVEGEDRHDLEPEGTREDTRHKIYTGSGSQSSYPTSCLE